MVKLQLFLKKIETLGDYRVCLAVAIDNDVIRKQLGECHCLDGKLCSFDFTNL